MWGCLKAAKEKRSNFVHIGNAVPALALQGSSKDVDRSTDDNQFVVFNPLTLEISHHIDRRLLQS